MFNLSFVVLISERNSKYNIVSSRGVFVIKRRQTFVRPNVQIWTNVNVNINLNINVWTNVNINLNVNVNVWTNINVNKAT